MKYKNNHALFIFLGLMIYQIPGHTIQAQNNAVKMGMIWTERSPMPGPLYAFNAVTIGQKVFAIGGRGNKQDYKYNYVYDLQNDTWKVKKDLIHDRSNHAVVGVDGKVFVFGGNENPNKTEVYDPQKDTWKELADMPTPRQHINYSAAAIDGKIYLMGGIEKQGERDFTIIAKNEMFDPATNTWTEKSPIPEPRQNPAVISYKDKIYVISGTDANWEDQTTVFVYHPDDDTWETKTPMPETGFTNGVAVVQDKIIFLTGKRIDQKISKIFIYDPNQDHWECLGELPESFMLAGVTSANGKLYVLGGSTHEIILSTCLEGSLRLGSPR